MTKQILLFLFINLVVFQISANQSVIDNHQIINKDDFAWRIGGKIHFEEESGTDYIGIKEINKIVREVIKKISNIECSNCAENVKILIKRDADKIQMTYFEEKSRPGIGEEMHSTLLYTQSRGFFDSETLKQVCKYLFEECDSPPTIEDVALKYNSIVKPDWKFEISEVIFTKGVNGASFVMLKLLFQGHERLFYNGNPISAGLHMALINFADPILSDEEASLLTNEINQVLKNKKIKIGQKNNIADLEFGVSGSPWRIRAGQRW